MFAFSPDAKLVALILHLHAFKLGMYWFLFNLSLLSILSMICNGYVRFDHYVTLSYLWKFAVKRCWEHEKMGHRYHWLIRQWCMYKEPIKCYRYIIIMFSSDALIWSCLPLFLLLCQAFRLTFSLHTSYYNPSGIACRYVIDENRHFASPLSLLVNSLMRIGSKG